MSLFVSAVRRHFRLVVVVTALVLIVLAYVFARMSWTTTDGWRKSYFQNISSELLGIVVTLGAVELMLKWHGARLAAELKDVRQHEICASLSSVRIGLPVWLPLAGTPDRIQLPQFDRAAKRLEDLCVECSHTISEWEDPEAQRRFGALTSRRVDWTTAVASLTELIEGDAPTERYTPAVAEVKLKTDDVVAAIADLSNHLCPGRGRRRVIV